MSRIIVIGANHAGTAAINTILDNYPQHQVVVFDANSNISFLGCGMALWIGNQIKGPEGLFYSSKELLEKKGAIIHMETAVTRIDFDTKTVYAENQRQGAFSETFDKLILATGSQPITPKIEGCHLENVQFVKRFQDAETVIHKLEQQKIRQVAVIGAGYIGVELAEAFVRNGKQVTLIDCADTCLTGYYDDDFCRLMQDNLEQHGVETAFGQRVVKIEGDSAVEGVITDQGAYPADMVVLAAGFQPDTNLGRDALKLFQNGAYLVDLHQQTSRPDVYAIGDCATVFDNALGDTNYIALATNAVRSGIVAAHNASGTPLQSIGVQGSNGISIWGFDLFSTGLTLKKAAAHGITAEAVDYEDYQKPAFMEKENEKVKIRIVFDKNSRVVLGAQMASRYDISMGLHLFSLAIQEKVTIDRLKLLDIFFLPHFNQPYNYITMAALKA